MAAGVSSGRGQGAVETVEGREREDGADTGGLSGEETGSAPFPGLGNRFD
jgi:hypothetical protein